MKYILALLLSGPLFSANAVAATCDGLTGMALAHTRINSAIIVHPQESTEAKSPIPRDLPAFCRVIATSNPSSDSNIQIEIWMPVSGWNGKYEGTGNGGYAGHIAYGELAKGVRRGYAVANTDMGTAPAEDRNGDALIKHPEKWADWGFRATHEMTSIAKQVIQAYYDQEPKRSYFNGCSTGGQQALMEAQRYPNDYDGIIAGAPANNRTRLHADILWNYVSGELDAASYISPEKLSIVSQTVLAACKKQDAGAESDKFLSDPQTCHWDPEKLLCKTKDASNCLTAKQVEAARKIYEGVTNPRTGAILYPGLPRGSEFGWPFFMPSPSQREKPPFDALFKWVLGESWDWRTFDFDHDMAKVDEQLDDVLNATNPDLSEFQKEGHKIIAYHGWADFLVPPQESINYYQSVAAAGRNQADVSTFYRLFMVPGMTHCAGGAGPDRFDMLSALEAWVEKGAAPAQITASHLENGKVDMTRPLCPYPQVARYNGTGDVRSAANFTCAVAH